MESGIKKMQAKQAEGMHFGEDQHLTRRYGGFIKINDNRGLCWFEEGLLEFVTLIVLEVGRTSHFVGLQVVECFRGSGLIPNGANGSAQSQAGEPLQSLWGPFKVGPERVQRGLAPASVVYGVHRLDRTIQRSARVAARQWTNLSCATSSPGLGVGESKALFRRGHAPSDGCIALILR